MKTPLYSIACAALLCGPAISATVGGITLPKTQDDLHLNGAGLLRKGFFFRIYVGALYLTEPYSPDRSLKAEPKRIDIHYFHHTPKNHMTRTAGKTLQNNLSEKQYEKLLPKIEQLHSAFMNGEKGSVASIIHIPEKGLVYTFDHQHVITIPGDEFANAYFSIWLGERPSSRTMKEAMLNRG